ncbi:hypothetical protein GQX73_g10845 [Xylaria multiplex]|uniref:Rhodopsin domain-containing protein n=1 Tax=Xylaria multiplex TaxID=323545 RepID=A0A7C8MHX3_9PEZI|nr:hypothetical protein GQX73_g10845 [Xylaria multiplex]
MLCGLLRGREPKPTGGIAVTDANLNPILQVVTWLLLALMSLILCFRQLTRCFIKAARPFAWEDILVALSFAFAIGESVAVLVPASQIFGKTIPMVTAEELNKGIKTGIARDFLFILCLGCSKLSVYLNLVTMSPSLAHKRIVHTLGGLIALWIITSLFGIGFEYGLCWSGRPNNCGSRFNREAFLTYVGVANIVTDLTLIAVPIIIIYPLRMALNTRLAAVAFYLARILVVITTINQLVYLPRLFEDDYTLSAFPYYLIQQLVQFTGFSATCIVYFWPFLRSIQSGLMTANASTTFTTQFPLTKLSQPNREKGRSAESVNISYNQDLRQYVEITTDVAAFSMRRKPSVLAIAERYNFEWER